MPEDIPPASQNSPARPESSNPTQIPAIQTHSTNAAPRTAFDISEEYGTAEKNLPPGKIVVVCLAILVVVVAIYAFTQRSKPAGTGYISDVEAVEVPNQHMVMAAVNISFRNTSSQQLWIHSIQADLATNDGNFKDDAAAAVDFARYFQAFPSLKQDALPAIQPGDKIAPGAQVQGTIIVTFPLTLDQFNHRRVLVITVWPDDQAMPLILKKPNP